MLWIGTGDGGAADDEGVGHVPGGNGQSLDTLLGKLLRIDPVADRGCGPRDPTRQPVRERRGATRDRAYGLRNPWKFSFDADTGALVIGDVGQNQYEEIDWLPAGTKPPVNFGWNIREGAHPHRDGSTAGLTEPVLEYSHRDGRCSISGGYVYRGTKIPDLRGTYLYSDNCDGKIRGTPIGAGVPSEEIDFGLQATGVSGFGQDHVHWPTCCRSPTASTASTPRKSRPSRSAAEASRVGASRYTSGRRDRAETPTNSYFSARLTMNPATLRVTVIGAVPENAAVARLSPPGTHTALPLSNAPSARPTTVSAPATGSAGMSPESMPAPSWNSVRVNRGHRTMQLTPVPFSSSCTAWLRLLTKALGRAGGRVQRRRLIAGDRRERRSRRLAPLDHARQRRARGGASPPRRSRRSRRSPVLIGSSWNRPTVPKPALFTSRSTGLCSSTRRASTARDPLPRREVGGKDLDRGTVLRVELLRQRLETGGVVRHGDEIVTACRELPGELAADAGGRAGDEGDGSGHWTDLPGASRQCRTVRAVRPTDPRRPLQAELGGDGGEVGRDRRADGHLVDGALRILQPVPGHRAHHLLAPLDETVRVGRGADRPPTRPTPAPRTHPRSPPAVGTRRGSRRRSPCRSRRPDFQVLVYPAIKAVELHPPKDAPPAFLIAGSEDEPWLIRGMENLYSTLRQAGVPAEMHLYDGVGHGFGIRARNHGPVTEWPQRVLDWMDQRGIAHPPVPAARHTLFNDDWRFRKGDAPGAEQARFDDRRWTSLRLPHDWAIEGPFDRNINPHTGALPISGTGWYRKTFTLPRNHYYAIEFDGAMANSKVWLNGHELGGRPYGYSGFSFDLTPYLQPAGKPNVIAVRLAPEPNSSRWYPGAGIYRNVWLDETDAVSVARWGTYVTTPEVSAERATVAVKTEVLNRLTSAASVTVRSSVIDRAGREVTRVDTPATIPSGAGRIHVATQLIVERPQLWDIDNPNLYSLVTEVISNDKVIDRYVTPFGIRTIGFDAQKGFSLNGRILKLHGVCLHHDLGALGAAVNRRAIERQLQILKGAGVNAIRTSHNPPAPELLEYADKMGFVVMDEAFDMWRIAKVPNGYSKYLRRMVRARPARHGPPGPQSPEHHSVEHRQRDPGTEEPGRLEGSPAPDRPVP